MLRRAGVCTVLHLARIATTMCERSFSDGSRGVGLGVPPHIRDALEQARLAAREAETPTRQSEFSRENTGEGIHSLARTAIRRESSFVQRLLNKEKQLMNIRTYVNDSLRSHKMHHAYLRNSFLDPAIGLEFKLLEHGAQQGVLMLPNPDVEALEKALAACEVAQNELKIENCRLHLRLRQAMERNNQLEQECENLYLQQRQEM
ncbi:unnamed protein product [Pelagomonas calceolata]|uniref:Uncharacterized protein n=1 Tax=Pelagomonas calceolata TaxID=35677 RepID=A0A8J2SCH4_9STRA|nr:unnamed protein product [Pelagomonas calceolata]